MNRRDLLTPVVLPNQLLSVLIGVQTPRQFTAKAAYITRQAALPVSLRPLDRIRSPVQRAKHGLVDQFASASIVGGQCLYRHFGFDDRTRRHGRDGVAQDIMDPPTAFTRLKPVVSLARRAFWPRRSL